MKKHFDNINSLYDYIERQAKRTIKFYYTDYKNYDRPRLMTFAYDKEPEIYLILRKCGSYIYTAAELLDPGYDFPAYVMDYYTSDESAKYYKLNMKTLTVETIPAGLPSEIKAERARLERIAA